MIRRLGAGEVLLQALIRQEGADPEKLRYTPIAAMKIKTCSLYVGRPWCNQRRVHNRRFATNLRLTTAGLGNHFHDRTLPPDKRSP
jgi:hypothetical protein